MNRGAGIDIEVQDENGTCLVALPDRLGLVVRLIPPVDDKTSLFLRFIDPFGDTTFNALQAQELISEIESRLSSVKEREVQDHWKLIVDLASQVATETHLYLKFLGD